MVSQIIVVDSKGSVVATTEAPPRDAVTYAEGVVLNRAVLQPTIVQLMQKEENAGTFRRIDTGETTIEIRAIPLMVQMGRLKWPAGRFSKDAKPECWSVDGIRGDLRPTADGRTAAFGGRMCLSCPFYQTRVTGEREKGLCHPTHAAIFYDEETGEPFIFRMTGMLNLDAKSIVGSKSNLNIRRRHLTLTSKKIEGQTGTYYRLGVLRGELLTPDEVDDMTALFELARQWELAMRTEETEADPLAGVLAPPPEEELPF